MLALASLTDSLVTFSTNLIGDLGLIGIFVLMLLESACIPIPSEVTMLFAGFNVSQGRFSLVAIIAAGVIGNLVGSLIAFGIGRYGREGLLERHGRRLHINERHLAWADAWFDRYGSAAVLFSRMLPVIRTFISLPAGAARMPLGRFTVLTVVGCIPWVILLAVIGQQVGHSWKSLHSNLAYVDYVVVAAAVIGIVYLIRRRPWVRAAA